MPQAFHGFPQNDDALRSLRDPVAFLGRLFERMPTAVAVWCADRSPLFANDAARGLFGRTRPSPPSIDDETFAKVLAGATVDVGPTWTEEGLLAVAATISPIEGADGAVAYVVATYRDVREEEEDLRITLDSIGDGVIATDQAGRITRMNPVAERLTGWTLDEARGRELAEVFHIINEDTRAVVETPVACVLREGIVVGLANHTILISRDGTERAIADSGAPIKNARGEIRGVVLVFHDQTAERRVEAALRASERRFRGFQESGVIGIVISSTSGDIKEANDAFFEMVGYTPDDLRAGLMSGKTLNTPDRMKTDAAAFREVAEKGVAHAWEKELVHKDGHRIPVLMGVVLVDEKTQESVAFALDLSARKRAEAAVRESEARRAAVMEAALDAIVLMDHEGRITDFNAAAEATLGYSREEVIGKPLADFLIPPELRDRHRHGLERYLATGEPKILGKRIEVPVSRKDRDDFPAEVAVVRIRSDGAPVFTGYIRDISERRKAAEAEILRREKQAAEEANRELEAFSYSVAHDLRAPLRAIHGFSGIVLEENAEKLDDDSKSLLRRSMASASRMGQLIDALLDLARLSRAPLNVESVDVSQLARSVVEQLRAAEPGRAMDIEIAEGLTADGDRNLLRAVLENLIGNAWKFTRHVERPHIEVGGSTSSAEEIRYFVRDNGAGFDMKHAGRLFGAFQRLHTTKQFEGTGVGLATVQRIIQRHGGTIWAEAVENNGATFHFTLSGKRSSRSRQVSR